MECGCGHCHQDKGDGGGEGEGDGKGAHVVVLFDPCFELIVQAGTARQEGVIQVVSSFKYFHFGQTQQI